MIKLTKGQLLKLKGYAKHDYEVISVIEGAAFIRYENLLKADWYTDEQIEDRFILPKERWIPEEGEFYYFIEHFDRVRKTPFSIRDDSDNQNIKYGNCFKTKEAAHKASEAVRKLLGEMGGE